MQPTLFSGTQWTVTTLTRHIREALESDIVLQDVWVQGEISNLSRPASGHVYFTLKDSSAALRCVMWKSSVVRLERPLAEGIAVVCHGKIGVYEVSGQYQLYVDRLTPSGEGALYQEFLRLKDQLEAEGLFASARKRPIPIRPRRIGIVTSQSAAALRDVLNTLRRRLPLAEVILAASAVQGVEAPAQLVHALERLNGLSPKVDVIVLVRGGGSIEDLWAFNDPQVVRAVVASEAPVISGVGHETDFTLADFAADLRAPTPTAAAEMATPVTAADLLERLRAVEVMLGQSSMRLLGELKNRIESAAAELRYRSPERRVAIDRQRLDELGRRLLANHKHEMAIRVGELGGWHKRLLALSPLQVLNRGYAVVTRRSDGSIIRSVRQAQAGIRVRVADGSFDADVGKSSP
jgi:exodeoxyribonuclease VII large subunit